jgi:hypothetical protein
MTTAADIVDVINEAMREFPDAVVRVDHAYTFAGTRLSATYSGGVKGSLTANQRITIAGSATTETFSVTCSAIPDGATEPAPVPIKEGDRVTLRKSDSDAGTVYSVLTRQADPTGATQTIILGPQYA